MHVLLDSQFWKLSICFVFDFQPEANKQKKLQRAFYPIKVTYIPHNYKS